MNQDRLAVGLNGNDFCGKDVWTNKFADLVDVDQEAGCRGIVTDGGPEIVDPSPRCLRGEGDEGDDPDLDDLLRRALELSDAPGVRSSIRRALQVRDLDDEDLPDPEPVGGYRIECPYCGMEIAAWARFCPDCGIPVRRNRRDQDV